MSQPTENELRAWRANPSVGAAQLAYRHDALIDALLALRGAARDVLDDYVGNVMDGESPERSYLRSLAAKCQYDLEGRMRERA